VKIEPPFKILFALTSFLGLPLLVRAQTEGPPSNPQEVRERYNQRIQQERLYGVYIPTDVADAIRQLYALTSEDARKLYAEKPEEEAVSQLHFSLGRWIIHNWGFYGGSRLSQYFRQKLQIYHPDDMARFIMIAFHRSIRKEELDIPGLIEEFHARQDSVRREKAREDSLRRSGKGNFR
jgi:hypothetical protein